MSDNLVCDPEVMCCTLNVLPNTPALLQKARLPLAVHVQPLKDIPNVPVVKVDTIVRCRLCRMYINPYVVIIDRHRWKCCMCSRFNDLPEDFSYDVKRKAYTNGRHRNEMNSSSYEVIASPEYIVGNLAVPVYFFLLDVSYNAIETGYLISLCQSVIEKLESLKTHDNVMVGVMTFHTSVHLYNIHHRYTKPIVYKLPDLENLFIPAPDGLLVNLKTSQSLFVDLLTNLPSMHKDNKEIGSCLGPALKLAYEILAPTGGRVSIFQTKIPDVGEGSLKSREDPNKRAGEVVQNLTAATDFYKKVALDGSSSHVAFDLFMLNTQYADLATLSVLSRYSGGCLFYFPNYHLTSNPVESSRFDETLDRYFSTNVGFEAVLRVRCTQGLSLQLFHGNGFVRSVDLLSLSSVTPDLSYAVQIQMEDSIEDTKVCIQAALLYTTNRFERRIRVHTICLPVSTYLSDVFAHANQMAITALVAKMAVDRSLNSSVADAREALTNVALDALNAYGENLSSGQRGGQLPCPFFLRALPLYILGLLKSIPFRLGVSTKLDDRVFMLDQFKTLPWTHIIKYIHPNFYPLHKLNDRNALYVDDRVICQPPLLPLSAGCMDRLGIYLLDDGFNMYLWLSSSVSRAFLRDVIGVQKFGDVLSGLFEFPHLDNVWSENVRNFIEYLQSTRSTYSPVILIRDDQTDRVMFYERLLEDRTSDVLNMSYIEFIRHLHSLVTY
ncbi:hypothetical protein HELRODRAFT_101510 [Helobdella robusta]|uniref:Protein transport protein SEC24 n=1 Tax=Helobdella robusta TaxID=6412 RepID=T1ED51_HELRO|nr:hypothetical protein HELRODRAFT_101510 [Helobdella robusta]ESN99520.1 hypothetical protein HELRODRAFT_101510 [Helobdella robusta]